MLLSLAHILCGEKRREMKREEQKKIPIRYSLHASGFPIERISLARTIDPRSIIRIIRLRRRRSCSPGQFAHKHTNRLPLDVRTHPGSSSERTCARPATVIRRNASRLARTVMHLPQYANVAGRWGTHEKAGQFEKERARQRQGEKEQEKRDYALNIP